MDFQHVVTYINEFVQKHRRANEVSQAFQLLSLCRSNRVINNENDIIDQSHTIGKRLTTPTDISIPLPSKKTDPLNIPYIILLSDQPY